MSNVRRKVGEGGEAENRFQRLPDDVVLRILGKLSDVKWLCRCFVVEKRFASLIPLVQTVSFEFDTKTWNSFFSNQDPSGYVEVSCFTRIFSDFSIENLTPERALLYYPQLRFPRLAFRLKHIQYLNIEIPSDYSSNNDSIFKWGATRDLESFTFLAAASLSKPDEEKDGKETENEIALSDSERKRQGELTIVCMRKALLWRVTLFCAVKTCLMLRSITITDSKNKGVKFCLSGEKLVEYRKSIKIMGQEKSLEVIDTLWHGYVPVLQLPVSRYVMKGVTIMHTTPFALDAFDGTAMLDAFAEEKGVFSEAMVQILEKHKSRIQASS